MDNLHFKYVSDHMDPVLDSVRPLFSEMYRGMRAQGLMLSLSDDGADKWAEGMHSTLGRFAILAVAEEEGKLIGFAHGALKFLPDYLGSYRTGVITHVFVRPSHRRQDVGSKLVVMLEEWFEEKKVHSVELQVISGNPAKDFWEKAGYIQELVQYRKFKGY
jgi:GNAT superfamily N-acetyltransferase